jgi:hypothetical protein
MLYSTVWEEGANTSYPSLSKMKNDARRVSIISEKIFIFCGDALLSVGVRRPRIVSRR